MPLDLGVKCLGCGVLGTRSMLFVYVLVNTQTQSINIVLIRILTTAVGSVVFTRIGWTFFFAEVLLVKQVDLADIDALVRAFAVAKSRRVSNSATDSAEDRVENLKPACVEELLNPQTTSVSLECKM